MDEREKEEKTLAHKEEVAALAILGTFLSVLGGAMIVAAFWPSTWVGRLTNLGVALLLLCIGVGMILRGRALHRDGRR